MLKLSLFITNIVIITTLYNLYKFVIFRLILIYTTIIKTNKQIHISGFSNVFNTNISY